MTYARSVLVPLDSPGFYHCISRCVRRAWLCGEDPYTGSSFEHRRAWVEDRLYQLAELFAVALYGYAVMSNHLHLVLHVDPEILHSWDDAEVARRWCALFPVRSDEATALEQQVRALLDCPARLAVCRRRLGSLSWFMRCLNEPIARRANREDDCSGRFWEGRFKCQALLDERAVLAAMAYVDLNPIRAGITTRLDESKHTSVAHRLHAARHARPTLAAPLQPVAGRTSVISLSIHASEYLTLVDWTGRQLRPDKTGSIPASAPEALARLGVKSSAWMMQVRGVGSGYWRAVGSVSALLDKASAMGQQWLKGLGYAKALEAG